MVSLLRSWSFGLPANTNCGADGYYEYTYPKKREVTDGQTMSPDNAADLQCFEEFLHDVSLSF